MSPVSPLEISNDGCVRASSASPPDLSLIPDVVKDAPTVKTEEHLSKNEETENEKSAEKLENPNSVILEVRFYCF